MSKDTKFDWSDVEPQEQDERAFLNFDESGELIFKFEEDAPFWNGIPTGDKFNREKFMFRVEYGDYEKGIFATASKMLMREFARIRPIENKTVKVTRAGQGISTQYKVEVL